MNGQGRGRGRGRGREGSPPPEQIIHPAQIIAQGPPPLPPHGRGVMMNLPPALPVQGVGVGLAGMVPQGPFPAFIGGPLMWGPQAPQQPPQEPIIPAMVALGFQPPPALQGLFPPLPPANAMGLQPVNLMQRLPPPSPRTPARRRSAERQKRSSDSSVGSN